ncbi:unnamed protein product [Mytilus coruscus]|uniref:Uncharacterized protein n=1 Tax=Mytilus coruscus TaxID=42192 RepID=A0A6J8BM15_MYTCO|nr:unnamed protein product [Mytilus coruscus]
MFEPMNMMHYVTGYTTDYLRKLQWVDNTFQQIISEQTTGYLDTFLDVSMTTQAHMSDYTRNYFQVLSDTSYKAHEYTKFYWKSALDFNSLLMHIMKHHIDDLVHPVLQQTTDAATYTYNKVVLPAVEYTSDSIVNFISFSENVNRRLKRNKGTRIPKTISRIENLYKLMDKYFDKRIRLLDEINYWCPVIMAQEKKLRMANKAKEDNGENGRVVQIRNLGSHVDLNLIRIKENLDDMSAGVKREMSITASLYDD